ncbi:MAG: SHOCT domain-containing protein [Prevotellaceae bacterium]|jgi:hypothetical protein|nr:SHOCT domain-containing protein [Prevotellaceae bacterium]
MRKISLICLSLIMSFTLFAQENKDGKMTGDILRLNNGVMLRKGTIMKLNGPLGDNSRFKYIHHPPDNLFDDMKANLTKPAEPYYAGKNASIRKIRYAGDKKDSKNGRWMIRIRIDDSKTDLLCDVVAALKSGEISAMQAIETSVQQVAPVQAAPEQPIQQQVTAQPAQSESKTSTAPAFSVADELLKLKKLLDEGIITKEEFEAQKKKLLDM